MAQIADVFGFGFFIKVHMIRYETEDHWENCRLNNLEKIEAQLQLMQSIGLTVGADDSLDLSCAWGIW